MIPRWLFKQMIPRFAAKIDTGQMATRNPVNSPVEFRRNENPLFAKGLAIYLRWLFGISEPSNRMTWRNSLIHPFFLVPGDIPTAVKAPSTLQSSQWPANNPTRKCWREPPWLVEVRRLALSLSLSLDIVFLLCQPHVSKPPTITGVLIFTYWALSTWNQHDHLHQF